jgi:hypothetical protein
MELVSYRMFIVARDVFRISNFQDIIRRWLVREYMRGTTHWDLEILTHLYALRDPCIQVCSVCATSAARIVLVVGNLGFIHSRSVPDEDEHSKKIKLHGLSPRANYTDRTIAVCR